MLFSFKVIMKLYEVTLTEDRYDDFRQETLLVTEKLSLCLDFLRFSHLNCTPGRSPFHLYVTVWKNGSVLKYKDFSYLVEDRV